MANPKLKVLSAISALALMAGCATQQPPAPVAEAVSTTPTEPPVIEPWGYPLDALDRNIAPGDDFYRFANGGWLERTPIPSDRSGTGFSTVMRDRNDERIATVISELVEAAPEPGTDEQKIRDLYLSFLDTERIEALGLTPIADDLARIRAATTHQDIAKLMADPTLAAGGPIAMFVGIDSKNPTMNAAWISHSGLSLPDRSYYLRESQTSADTRAAFQAHIARMFGLLELEENEPRAAAVMALETEIAQSHWTRADRRNADRTYNPVTLANLEQSAPGFPWSAYADAAGFGLQEDFIARELEAMAPLAALFAATPVDIWRDYLLFQTISSHADFLPEEIAQADFEFFGTTLRGRQTQRPRNLRAINLVNGRLSQAVGQIYIQRFFPEDSKRQMEEMFQNIRLAFAQRIEELEWMSPDTKIAAQRKLAWMTARIAYPEVWRDYSALDIKSDDLIGNIKRARAEAWAYSLSSLGQPVNTEEWITAPQTVNAFYSPARNEVFIPAGYIQSPLFDPNADPALNYGAIGSIIGHEIGHGFDDQGSKYDADGTLRQWWTDDDRAAFDELGDKLAAQFDQYEMLPGLNVNGRQTLGENIGDLAGVTVAYHAYLLSLNGQKPPVIDGFTGPQRVFLGRAQARRFKRTDESLRERLLSAPHSPMSLRVNGMIRNMDEWYEAFDIQPGDELYLSPEDRVKIW